MIGFAKMLKKAKQNFADGSANRLRPEEKGIPLVNCSKCGVWVPQTKSIKVGDVFVCSDHSTSRVNA
jgi:ribosomal protein S26